jgi:glycosyltransferase involved in cell wall biosynthesis
MPEVSIIVPNYNHAKFLKLRLDSIFNQTFQDFEVILLDDCSTDNSREVIEEYQDHEKISHIILNAQNSGSTYNQWIKGIILAKGEFIWIAESDDIAEYNFLEVAILSLKSNNCSIFFSQSWIIDEHGSLQGKWNQDLPLYKSDFIKNGDELIREYLINENIIPNASAVVFAKKMIRNEILESLKSFRINGDWFLWITLLENHFCAFSSMPLNYFRRHAGAGSLRNVINFKNIEEAFRINKVLSEKGYTIDGKSWMNSWIDQANYSIFKILKRNFREIYKQSKYIYPFPIAYILHSILRKKIKRLFRL